MQVGKRLRIILSDNNAGIDDVLLGGVVPGKFRGYNLVDQWTSYGWNVFTVEDGSDYAQIVSVLKTMEDWDPADRRPMIVVAKTTKGYWPRAVEGKIPGHGPQLVSYQSHPYGMKMNSDYFVALARTFEEHYGVEFEGIRKGPVTDPRERLIQFKTNIDVVMSLLDRNGLGDWLAERLVSIGDTVKDEMPLSFDVKSDPFLDDRLRVANLPVEPQTVTVTNRFSGAEKQVAVTSLPQAGRSGRRAPRHLGNHQVDELRHGQPLLHAGGRSFGIDQRGARQPLGPLRSRNQSARHAHQSRDSGSGQRCDRHRPDRPERQRRSRKVLRRLGAERHLRRLHAADVHARARLEPAESGQQIPHGRAAHSGGPFRARRPRPTGARTSAFSPRRCGSCSRAARPFI